jgi:hypothetical protein
VDTTRDPGYLDLVTVFAVTRRFAYHRRYGEALN